MTAPNPFCTDGDTDQACVFVPREAVYRHINQYLADPISPHAFVLLGVPGLGKSTLLRRFDTVFPASEIGIYLQLGSAGSAYDETQLLEQIAAQITTALQTQIITPDELLPEDGYAEAPRIWFRERFLPRVFRTLRSRRRLVLLLDDADVLFQDSALTEPDKHHFLAYLSALLAHNTQLACVLALNNAYETELQHFAPLVSLPYVHRLSHLTLTETVQYINSSDAFTVDDAGVGAVFAATGGSPMLVQRYGALLHDRLQEAGHTSRVHLSLDAVRAALPQLAQTTHSIFHEQWGRLALNERLVLTALGDLLYKNPQRAVAPEQIETWLVKTDYPLDMIAVKAAIRRLEYDLLVRYEGKDIVVTSGLLKSWLVNNTRLDAVANGAAPHTNRPVWRWVGVGITAVLILLLLALVLTAQRAAEQRPSTAATNVPTVTLEQGNGS